MDGGNVPNNQYVTVGNAATVTGISERTLRYWIKSGKRGCLVRLADVEALASLTGNAPATSGNDGNAAASAATTASNDPNGNDSGNAAMVSDQGRQQLEVIRDTLLAPLIAQNDRLVAQMTEQAEMIGKLRAERDELQSRLEALERPEGHEARSQTSARTLAMSIANLSQPRSPGGGYGNAARLTTGPRGRLGEGYKGGDIDLPTL
jgi:hypothetical protein